MLDVDCYDFKIGKWTTLAARLPLGTGGGTAVNLDNKLFFIGGERATDTEPNGPQKDVYYLNPETSGDWVKAADLNKARNGVGGAVLDHHIYIAGGSGGGPGGPPPPNGIIPGSQPNRNNPNGMPPGQIPQWHDNKITLEVFTLK